MSQIIQSKCKPVGEHRADTSKLIKPNEAFIFRNILLRALHCLLNHLRLQSVQQVSDLANLLNSTNNVDGKVVCCRVSNAGFCPRRGLLETSSKKTLFSTLQPAGLSSQLLVRMESLHSSMWDKWKTETNENNNSGCVLWRIMSVRFNTDPLV